MEIVIPPHAGHFSRFRDPISKLRKGLHGGICTGNPITRGKSRLLKKILFNMLIDAVGKGKPPAAAAAGKVH